VEPIDAVAEMELVSEKKDEKNGAVELERHFDF
jgi:hypothetical protein